MYRSFLRPLSVILIISVGCVKQAPLVYRKPITEKIATLDPSKTRFRPDYMIAKNVLGQLLLLDAQGEIKPGILESWRVDRSGTLYEFQMRKDVKFHSGRLVTIDDVIFTFHYLAGPDSLINRIFLDIDGLEEFQKGKTSFLRGIKKIDDRHFSVKLTGPSFVFLVNLADPKVALVPNRLNGLTPTEFFLKPDGAGPYRLSAPLGTGGSVVLIANNDYFGSRPLLPTIELIQMSTEKAMDAFKSSKVEDLELYTVETKRHAELSKVGLQFSVSAFSNSFLFFNGRRPIWHQLELRRYLAQSVDIEPLVRRCDLPYVKAFGFIPKGILGWFDPKYDLNDSSNVRPVSLNKARFKVPNQVNFVSYGSENNPCILQGIVNQLRAAGFNIKYEHIDQSEITNRLEKGSYDLFFEFLSVRGSEPYHLLTYFDPRSRHNLTWFKDPTISKFTDQIKRTPAQQLRGSLYRNLDRYLSREKIYFVPLFSDIRHYFFSKRVQGPPIPAMISMNNGFEEIGLK